MSLKESVLEHIKKHGPQTNAELVAKFKIKKASMRRTCGELVKEGKISPVPSKEARLWGITADVREPVVAEKPRPAMPAPTAHKKRVAEDPPLDLKDWRMTDFCF